MHANLTGRTSLRARKSTLYYFFKDAAAEMEARPLTTDDTYELEISFADSKTSLSVKELSSGTVVLMKTFHTEE